MQNANSHIVTHHACEQMAARGISQDAIQAALAFGKEVYTRGAIIYALGKKEAKRAYHEAGDLSRFSGVQVVCSHRGIVLTAYRNRNFRGLRN